MDRWRASSAARIPAVVAAFAFWISWASCFVLISRSMKKGSQTTSSSRLYFWRSKAKPTGKLLGTRKASMACS